MDFRSMEILIWLVKDPNLQRTAERLKLTQPTLSRRLALLEEHVGQTLFERRGTKGLEPTPQAIELAASAKKLMDSWTYATNVAMMKGSKKPYVNITGPSLFMQTIVAPIWSQSPLSSDHLIHFQTQPVADINFEVSGTDLDAAFLFDKTKALDYKFYPICVERMAFICNVDCKVSPEAMLKKKDDGLQWLSYRPDRDPLAMLTQSGILPQKHISGFFEDLPSLLNVVAHNPKFATVLPYQSLLHSPTKLKGYPLQGTEQTLHYVFRSGEKADPLLKKFGELMVKSLRDHPYFLNVDHGS